MSRIKWLMLGCIIFATTTYAQDNPLQSSLLFGEPMAGELGASESNTWLLAGVADQVVTISAALFPPNPDNQLDPILELYDPTGNLIATDDNSSLNKDALIFRFMLPTTGDYQVVVRNQTNWVGGSYLLTAVVDQLPEGCQTPQGTMIIGSMPSVKTGGVPVQYRVFMPPCHDVMHKRYPYALLMHGSVSTASHWDDLGLDEALVRGMALNQLPPMVLVLPYGGGIANINTFGANYSWEHVIIDELMPYMESTYCLQNSRDQRAIGGISRGGFWAFEIALRNPQLFEKLGGHSPYFDLYHAPASNNPLDLALTPFNDPPLTIWMDRGWHDYAQLNIDLIHTRFDQNGVEHTYNVYAVGEHQDRYWSSHVDDYLNFYSQNWTFDYTELPDCEVTE